MTARSVISVQLHSTEIKLFSRYVVSIIRGYKIIKYELKLKSIVIINTIVHKIVTRKHYAIMFSQTSDGRFREKQNCRIDEFAELPASRFLEPDRFLYVCVFRRYDRLLFRHKQRQRIVTTTFS